MFYRYPVFVALPWFTRLFVSTTSVKELGGLVNTSSHPYEPLLLKLIERIALFEDEIPTLVAADVHRLLQFDRVPTMEERASFIQDFNAERLSKCISGLLNYRFVDILLALEMGFSAYGQTKRIPTPLPAKMHFKRLDNWKELLQEGLLHIAESDNDATAFQYPTGSSVAQILVSLVNRNQQIGGQKILANLECAAAYIALLQQDAGDLPNTIPQFKKYLMSLVPPTQSHEAWDLFFSSMKNRPCLQVTSSNSHCGLSNCAIPTITFNDQGHEPVLSFLGLGGNSCPVLRLCEKLIWTALCDAASGKALFVPRIRILVRHLASALHTDGAGAATQSLSPDPLFLPTLQRLRQEDMLQAGDDDNPAALLPSEIPKKTVRFEPPKPATRSSTRLSSTPAAHLDSSTPRVLSPRSKSSTKSRASPTPPAQDPSTSKGSPSAPAARIIQLPKRDAGADLDDKPRKRRIGEGRVYEVIDLTAETAPPPVIDLTLDTEEPLDTMESFVGPVKTFRSLPGRRLVNFTPRYKYRKDHQWCQDLLNIVESHYVRGSPVHLVDSEASRMAVMVHRFASTQSAALVQATFRHQHLVLLDMPLAPYDFDDAALNMMSMFNLDRVVPIEDFSLPVEQRKGVHGTLRQLLEASKAHSKPLLVPRVPMPEGVMPILALTSDVVAWNYTFDQPWCGRRWEMPRSATKWGSAFTSNTYLPMTIAPNGFATYIEVKVGIQLVIVGTPAGKCASFSSLEFLEKSRLGGPSFDMAQMKLEAFPLRAGCAMAIRPFTPYAIISVDDSITHNSSFIAASTIRSSCFGYMYSLISSSSRNNPSHQACRMLLRRMVHYLHLVYLGGRFLEGYGVFQQPPELAHVPDLFTFDGVVDLLSICNLFEMANVLSYEAYMPQNLPEYDRTHFIQTRKLCREMVHWAGSRLLFVSEAGHDMDLHRIQMRYLAIQSKALVKLRYRLDSLLPQSHIRGEALELALEMCFKGNDSYMKGQADVANYIPDNLDYPQEWCFRVHPRRDVIAINEIFSGETYDDLVFLASLEGEK
ncbi:hypothetical protein BKA70DRAFT_1418816 [Coprinopsis sp. MPI-PUGE-AT-0042]|nr:hypothetical protein BKA70DRAFT_1418816 [Coprinopsis sp. MPI-PUGE-AT-0042]